MRKGLHNKFLAGLLTFSVVVSGSGIYSMVNGVNATAEDTEKELTKILEAKDIDIRTTWEDTSNIAEEGEERTKTLANGDEITIKDNGVMRTELSSQDLADEYMGMGINLGNTLEATYPVGSKASITDRKKYDTAWGNSITTRAYIDKLHSYGINTLRIPVAWSNGDIDDGKYNIKEELLDRVEEVANYALDNGMYVIINDHWDNQWWGQFGACVKDSSGNKVVDKETRANAWKRYESYWTQISERFKDYSDHLIFEGANEELGERLNDGICVNGGQLKGYAKPDDAGKDVETVSGNLTTDEMYATTNQINQKFVDIVRNTGGNNRNRHLLIPGFNTNFQDTADKRYEMPTDIEENGTSKLFLSVHYYTPGDFCLDSPTEIYSDQDQAATKEYFKDLKRFNDEGYAIILGECGVCEPSAVSSSVTQWFYDTFKEAMDYHTVPVLWDTGAYFDREEPAINYKDIAIFLNTLNGAEGTIDSQRNTGGAVFETGGEREIPDYIDSTLWKTPGLHAYISYQMSNWDYRDAYAPLRTLSKAKHSWEYIKASGAEVTADKTTVTDVRMTANGQYTVAIDGIDLSGSNSFKMLSISTDIDKRIYSDVTITNATVKFDGEEVTEEPVDLTVKTDNNYYTFMVINTYGKDVDPLDEANENETLIIPTKSIEITFTINGLDQVIADFASGDYVDPETGEKIPDPVELTPPPTEAPTLETTVPPADSTGSSPAPTETAPVATETPAPAPVVDDPGDDGTSGLQKGATFTSGNFQYKVTKAATEDDDGTVALIGLTSKGKSAKKLTVPNSVDSADSDEYEITTLGNKAFSGAKATSITLNKKIKVIPDSAFANCTKLTSITFKAKLTKAAKNSFKGCKKKIKIDGTKKAANKKLLKKQTSYKKFK